MGNLLGFIIPIALAITQPQLFGIAFKRLRQYAAAMRDYAIIWNEIFQSILARTFWKLALLAMFAELALAMLIYREIEESQVPWYMWALPAFLSLGQLLWAGFNLLTSARETTTETICGKTTTTANPVYAGWGRFSALAHPLTWLAFTSLGFLAQGGLLEYHTLVNAPSYSYGDQQVLILLAFFSKLMYGVMALATSSILGWLIVGGTRFLERTSTLIAKLIVSIDLNIEFNKNALQEIGGEIDFLDEEEVASKIKYLFTVLFTPILIFDLAIFIWPSQILAVLILFGIAATGILEFVFGSMGEGPKAEAKRDRVDRLRVIFKLGPMAGIAVIALAYAMQSATGRNIQVEVENFWYGVSYIPVLGFWTSLGFGLFALAAYHLLKKAFFAANDFVNRQEVLPDPEGGWRAIPGRYFGSWPALLLWLGSGVLAFALFFSAFYSFVGGERYKLGRDLVQESVKFEKISAGGTSVTVKDPSEPWPLPAPDSRGRVYVKFHTPEKAFGIVEFNPPSAALEVGMSSFIPVQTIPIKGTVENDNGETEEKILNYEHIADFEIPENFSGKYRIVMRNAEKSPQVNPYYGKSARTAEFDHTLQKPLGYWARFCAWWSDLWDDDDYDPPKRVIVYTAPAPRPVYVAPAPKPCKVKPLKVEPALRDQIAARNGR